MGFVRTVESLLGLLAIVALSSCAPANPPTLSGRTAAGEAQVWLDLDGDYLPGAEEPQGRTTPDGDYSLRLPRKMTADNLAVLVRVEAGRSRSRDGRIAPGTYLLAARAGGNEVSIWTTLALALVAGGDALDLEAGQEQILAAFALPAAFDFSPTDPRQEEATAGLAQVVEQAYGQKAAEFSARAGVGPQEALISAAREVLTLSALLLDLVDHHTLLTSQPPLTGTPTTEGSVFFGNFSATPINSTMAYGIGLDEATYGLKGVCTEAPLPFDGLCANDYNYTFDLVESVDELSKKMAIGAAAKAGVSVAGFDVVSVSGEYKFIRNSEFKNDSLYLLFRVEEKLCGYPATPALKPEWDAKFTSNYEEFRAVCGDRYLSSITSGGVFAALIEVKKDEKSSMEEFRLTLSGKVLGMTVYKKSWKETVSDISQSYTTSTRVLSNTVQYSDNYLSVAEVFKSYDDFAVRMQREECSNAEGGVKCGYLATFSPYETIATAPPGNIATLRNRLARMQSLESYYFDSADLRNDINEILLQPDDFNIGNRVDAFTRPNDWTLEKLEEWQNAIRSYQEIATGEWNLCRGTIEACTKDPAALGLPSWLELKKKMPTRKFIFPESCTMLAEQFGITLDGEHRLFLGGDVAKSYLADCRDMASSAPQTYLLLANRSANVTAPDYNYSSLHYAASSTSSGVVFRTFSALRVEPGLDAGSGRSYLEVSYGQRSHTVWGAEPILAGESQALLADSLDILEAQGQGGAEATANLNLEGTPFCLSPALEIKGEGAFSKLLFPISLTRKNIDLSVTGGSAAAKGMIRLEWAAEGGNVN